MLFNDRRATKRALKAANGPSLASKKYKPDTAGRAEVNADPTVQLTNKNSAYSRKIAYENAAKKVW
jgi:hypothetical protein